MGLTINVCCIIKDKFHLLNIEKNNEVVVGNDVMPKNNEIVVGNNEIVGNDVMTKNNEIVVENNSNNFSVCIENDNVMERSDKFQITDDYFDNEDNFKPHSETNNTFSIKCRINNNYYDDNVMELIDKHIAQS